MAGRKDLRHASPQKLSRGGAQKFFRSGTDHHGARTPREQQQAVLESRHDRIHVFAHRAEDFIHPAQLLPDLGNFPPHQSDFTAASSETISLPPNPTPLSPPTTVPHPSASPT